MRRHVFYFLCRRHLAALPYPPFFPKNVRYVVLNTIEASIQQRLNYFFIGKYLYNYVPRFVAETTRVEKDHAHNDVMDLVMIRDIKDTVKVSTVDNYVRNNLYKTQPEMAYSLGYVMLLS